MLLLLLLLLLAAVAVFGERLGLGHKGARIDLPHDADGAKDVQARDLSLDVVVE